MHSTNIDTEMLANEYLNMYICINWIFSAYFNITTWCCAKVRPHDLHKIIVKYSRWDCSCSVCNTGNNPPPPYTVKLHYLLLSVQRTCCLHYIILDYIGESGFATVSKDYHNYYLWFRSWACFEKWLLHPTID